MDLDIGGAVERHPTVSIVAAIAAGFALFVALHGGDVRVLGGVSRGLKGQVSNQELLGVAQDTTTPPGQGFADIDMLNNYFASLQRQIDDLQRWQAESGVRA